MKKNKAINNTQKDSRALPVNKNLLKILIVIFLIIISAKMLLSSCSKNNAASEPVSLKSGFEEVSSVDGVAFQVQQSVLDRATAVTQISEGATFNESDTYVYKDGKSRFLLFGLNSLVIAVEKDTDFHFESADSKETALENGNINNIWFSKAEKKFSVDSSNGRSVANATGGVVITTNQFNDFTGRLVTLTDGNTEWGMFVGVPGTSYKEIPKKQKEAIEDIIETFTLSDHSSNERTEYAISISGNTSEPDLSNETSQNALPVETPDDVIVEESTVSADRVSDNSISPNSISDNNATEDAEGITEPEKDPEEDDVVVITEGPKIIPRIQNDTVIEPDSLDISASIEADTSEENEADNNVSEEESSEESIVTPSESKKTTERTRGEALHLSNVQVHDETDAAHAYSSSVYSMLTPGTTGLAASVSKTTFGAYAVGIQKVYTDASQFVDDMYTLPDGCHWEAIEYSVVYTGEEQPYVNTKIIGNDGKALRYRGIKYSTRTFDANENAVKNGNTVTHLIAYYAVPNGCSDYSILIGDVVEKYGGTGAYYYISHK